MVALLVAGTAWAGDPIGAVEAQPLQFKSDVPMAAPQYDQELIWSQDPHIYWWTLNASTPFMSELADDIPDAALPASIWGVGCIALEWGGYWMTPGGVILSLYDGGCPPSLNPFWSMYFDWNGPYMETALVYDDPGWMTAYVVSMYMPEPVCVSPRTSLGFMLDIPMGPPYGGFVMTNDYDVYGCGEAYWDGTYWGYPRWGTISGFFGVSADVSYALYGEPGPSATEQTTWGSVKSLYE
jgi:hypothetical protein